MFAIKLTLILLGLSVYLVGTGAWFIWIGPDLVGTGTTESLLYAFAFAGTCAWLLITFGLAVHIIKTARPTAGGGR